VVGLCFCQQDVSSSVLSMGCQHAVMPTCACRGLPGLLAGLLDRGVKTGECHGGRGEAVLWSDAAG
jgi:hypothetical protein